MAQLFFVIAGAAFAFFAVACIVFSAASKKRKGKAKPRAPDVCAEMRGLSFANVRCINYMAQLTRRMTLGKAGFILPSVPGAFSYKNFEADIELSGLGKVIERSAFNQAQVRLCLLFAVCAGLLGLLLSNELGAVGCILGAFFGFRLPAKSLKAAKVARTDSLERSLSELLEVVALGVRSGLSFDRSLRLYTQHFSCALARECEAAQKRWSLGLASREDALKDLAASYDSALFSRVIASVVRSLRFGSSLGPTLEAAAGQARDKRRVHIQEHVAKAPVKMMIPTGTLILPAMLLLVLGPVLLELMKGF